MLPNPKGRCGSISSNLTHNAREITVRASMDSTISRFRFRDQGMDDDSTESDSGDSDSSASGPGREGPELKSMTGKGIKRLCSELLELKKASDDDFYRSVYANYSTFVRIFKEVEGLENELMELKQHISTQRKLLYDLTHGIYPEVLWEELESNSEGTLDTEQHSPLSDLETHSNAVTETLDILISEHRLNEALLIFEMEPVKFQRILSREDFPTEIVMSYEISMSERRKRLVNQFIIIAEHPRISAPEFQKALSGLCRLGNCHRANLLLLQFYGSRFEDGILDLQRSKPFMQETYIRELAKYVFSVISQAGKSFVALHGETSPYTSEFMQWAREKTEVFVYYFDKYVKSISETTGSLSIAVEAVQHAISFCSLLESQKILLQPYLTKIIRPCLERVLQMHIDHFKKVIGTFTSTDTWVPGRYLVTEVGNASSHQEIGGKLEYCLLTSSGRKFVTVVQAIIEDVLPLVSLQMENSILKGLYDLFNMYVDILQRSIPNEGNAVEKGSPRPNLAKTLYQQLSLLANVSTLVLQFLSRVTGSIFKAIKCSEDEASFQQMELASWILSIQEAADRLRAYFCHQFVSKIMSLKDEQSLSLETYIIDRQNQSCSLHDLLPSATFQVLFLQLRQLEKLSREVFVGSSWEVEDLQRELMGAVFLWIANNEELWAVIGGSSLVEQSSGFEQFLLDMQFLQEIARFGGYFSDNLMDVSLGLIEHMEMKFLAAGLRPNDDAVHDGHDGWAATAVKAAIDKLLEIEKTKLSPMEEHVDTLDKNFNQLQHGDADNFDDKGGERCPEDHVVLKCRTTSGSEQTISMLEEPGKAEMTTMEKSPVANKQSDSDGIARNVFDNSEHAEDAQEENSGSTMTLFLQEIEEKVLLPSENPIGVLMEDSDKEAAGFDLEEDTASSCSETDRMLGENVVEAVNSGLEHNAEPDLSAGVELVLEEDSSDAGVRWPTANEVVIAEQQESERVDLTAMERCKFILDESSHGQEE